MKFRLMLTDIVTFQGALKNSDNFVLICHIIHSFWTTKNLKNWLIEHSYVKQQYCKAHYFSTQGRLRVFFCFSPDGPAELDGVDFFREVAP